MPLDGRLLATRYVPGDLFSVNAVTATHVDDLFARNERLVCHFETPRGPMAMVLVGAMIVAAIETVWAGRRWRRAGDGWSIGISWPHRLPWNWRGALRWDAFCSAPR
jgi:phosphatidylserine decarboxylase